MDYRPSKWQQEFHALTTDEALGGGCAGPGKSLALLMDPMAQVVVEHERCRVGEIQWGRSMGWALHMRREMPRLETTIHRSKMLFLAMDPGAKYDEQRHKWTFSSGYQFTFAHCKDRDSFINHRSNDYTHLGIDEASEIEHRDIFDELSLRVRTVDPVLKNMLKVRLCSNPCATWLRQYFVEPAIEGRKILRKTIRLDDGSEVERTRIYLPARLADNPDPIFRRQYETSLRDRPYHIRASLLLGDWFCVAGSYFADIFDPQRVVIKPFKIPAGWKRFRSGDWGYKSPCVVLWWAVSPDGEMICFRELTVNGPKARELLDAHEVALRIKEIEIANGEWNHLRGCSRLTGPMDTNLWQEVGHKGPTMAHDMAAVGVYWTKASKGRRMCTQQLVKRLHQHGYNDRAGIMFFDTCIGCITTIPAIGTDPEDPEVPAKGGPDHHLDAVFYACSYNALPSGVDDIQQDDNDDIGPRERASGGRGKFRGYI